MELLHSDLTSWEVGPYHSMLPGAMILRLRLDGEIVASGATETGFLHRGLEKAFEKHSWLQALSYADRLDPEGAVFGELALCLAVEELGEIEVPPRAKLIRVILSELCRITCHLGFVARLSRSVGAETMFHYVLRDRERVLDLFELLSGARFSLNFLRYGGVSSDVSEGFVERVLETGELIRQRLKEYNDLLSFNQAFIRRTVEVGMISPELARTHGVTGTTLRASGNPFDVRKAYPYSGYENMEFEVPLGGVAGKSDAHERYLLRLKEISQSLEILKQATDSILPGEFCNGKPGREFKVKAGEAYSRVESARGLLGCHVVSDGKAQPCRVQFRVPSLSGLAAIPELLVGSRLEDVPVILASLDLSMAEADR